MRVRVLFLLAIHPKVLAEEMPGGRLEIEVRNRVGEGQLNEGCGAEWAQKVRWRSYVYVYFGHLYFTSESSEYLKVNGMSEMHMHKRSKCIVSTGGLSYMRVDLDTFLTSQQGRVFA